MPYEQIRVEKQNSVCIITLNRPEKLNAWTPDMSRELGEAITAANEDDEIGAIVMTGEGRGFCAGADMSYFQNNIDASENKAPLFKPDTSQRISAKSFLIIKFIWMLVSLEKSFLTLEH